MQGREDNILTDKSTLQERKFRLRWLVAFSTIPFLGIVAAFGIVSEPETPDVPVQTVIENINLPIALETAAATPLDFWQEERVQRGDTLASVLTRLNVRDPNIIASLRKARTKGGALLRLKPGATMQAQTTEEGKLLSLRYIFNGDTMISVDRSAGYFAVKEQTLPTEARVLMKSAEITSSLFAATDAANLPDAIATQLSEIFSSEIDFHRELKKGDKFTVVYEAFYNKGAFVKTGRLLAAEFINGGRSYRAVFYQDPHGRGGYYTPQGKNLRKAFLKSPLEFSRISSGFSASRFHPVLKRSRAHKGVDYAAPTGTRVKATADGVVAFAGQENGYGNVIEIRHPGNYTTVYGHLSGFAKGMRKGQKVSQGDVIGYVGMTGLATGPHLHYEFHVAGVERNPLSVAVPVAFPIEPQYFRQFAHAARPLVARLELLRPTNLALLE